MNNHVSLTQKDLVEIAYRWVLKEAGCAASFREYMKPDVGECPVIGFASFGKSVLVQVNTTRAEFDQAMASQFWLQPENNMGRYRFLCVPQDLVQPEELPERWGLLYVDEAQKITCVYNPYSPNGSYFWRNGFEDENLYNLLGQNEQLYAACRRFKYMARFLN
ncbi:hypothetical protein [Rufibacter immobilis]|uniref:hypothetical protein n=1 Tax=Rufibacter immobilis TaxID=1348778 RepID=UPI0011CD7E34|nr:hypothetical protein [Rufibacter immobilis]